ncbi:MAG: hypothetical protein NXI23_26945 [Bacteroidetes bacterium]|jgi:hypothetical protein|nr:hypothetical protein [Bacteroidota bacterium]MDF1868448.1 hypothetical protein [Saprospiraceae bacterium]
MKTTIKSIQNLISKSLFTDTLAIAFFVACFMGVNPTSYAQPSIAAENTIDDISVTTKYGEQKVYTVFQDAQVSEQWYYMPNELRVAERVDVNGNVRPKMTILRYQYQDIKTKENQEGGILVASFTYAMEPEVVEDAKRQIQRKTGNSKIRLSAIPLNSSSIDFLSDSGKFIGNKDAKVTFNGATSASQEIVISYDLTVLGASVFKALASSKGGIPIRANITYNGLTAPCGYKIKGNWNNVYNYFEENTKKEAGLKVWFLKAGGTKTKQKVRETLNNIKGMEVDIVECESTSDSTQSMDDANMYALISKIQNEVFSDSLMGRVSELEKLQSMLVNTNDKQMKERLLDMMTKGEKALKLGYQNSIKDVKKRRKGSINYDFARQRMVVRPSTFGGLLSFSKYGLDEETLLKEEYIIDVDVNSDFPTIIMGLPHINPDFDLRALTLEVSHTNSDGEIHSEARQWTTESKVWTSPMGAQVDYLQFNMLGEKDKSKLNEPQFDMQLKVISNIPNASFTIQKTIKLNRGERYIDALELLTNQIIVDGSVLDFAKITNESSDLALAKLELKKGDLTIKKSIKPFFINNNPTPPNPLYVLFPKNDAPLSSKVTYYKKEGKTKSVIDKEAIELGENVLIAPDWIDETE